MRMAVHDAGQHAPALGVQDGGARTDMLVDGVVVSERDDAPAERSQGGAFSAGRVHRRDPAAEHDEVGVHAAILSSRSRSLYQPPTTGSV